MKSIFSAMVSEPGALSPGARSALRTACALLLLFLAGGQPAPATAQRLSAEDVRLYRQTFDEVKHGHWNDARRLAARGHGRLAGKIVYWLELTSPGSGLPFEEFARFIDNNPDWPNQDLLRQRAEEAMDETTTPRLVVAWFHGQAPLTTNGRLALATALTATGKESEGRAMLRQAWIEGDFTRSQARRFLRHYGKSIRDADHRGRLDRLIWDGRYHQAERMLHRVDSGYRAVAVARIRLARMKGGVDAAIDRVPKRYLKDPGFLFERMRWRRRKDRDEDAMEILRHAPKHLAHPARWWPERALIARRMLAKGNVTDAFRAAAEHGLSPRTDRAQYAEAEWLAGWIELRFLEDNAAALKRFVRLHEVVTTPTSRARAAYWAARAAEALGRKDEARDWYARAARNIATYYGQLAAQRVSTEDAPVPVPLPAEPQPTKTEREAFGKNEMVRAARLLAELGEKKALQPFLLQAAKNLPSAAEKALVAHLARTVGRPDLAVRISRAAYRDGLLLATDGYPVLPMPDGQPERALLLAIARQESNFDPLARSGAGARGLMQIMPATARAVARRSGIRYSLRKLGGDPSYNLKLGRAYVGMLLDQFNGSYVLALAAYNAGPGNAGRWVQAFGDPRDVRVDAVDWIEMIPYNETRTYVQRVLANLQIYRQRLGSAQVASMAQDLRR